LIRKDSRYLSIWWTHAAAGKQHKLVRPASKQAVESSIPDLIQIFDKQASKQAGRQAGLIDFLLLYIKEKNQDAGYDVSNLIHQASLAYYTQHLSSPAME
jgi:hypothetical protein